MLEPESESIVNWEGLPGDGAQVVAERLIGYDWHMVPLTINLMSTPGKQGDAMLRDIEGTILATRDVPYVDRFELNISCPNLRNKDGADTREENHRMLGDMLYVVESNVLPNQEVYVKVSPDSGEQAIFDTARTLANHNVSGIVTANTSRKHNRKYIPDSPVVEGEEVGGASGNAVYDDSLITQGFYNAMRRQLDADWNIIACGGINSLERVAERLHHGATGIQIYTPLVFSGPKLLRELRSYKGN